MMPRNFDVAEAIQRICQNPQEPSTLAEREQIVAYFQPRVARMAWNLCAKKSDAEDLAQVGLIALFHAIEKYDRTQGVKFWTYASRRVNGAMIDELRSGRLVHTVKLPRSVITLAKGIVEASEEFKALHNRSPTLEETLTQLSARPKRAILAAALAYLRGEYRVENLHAPIDGDEGRTLEQMVPDRNASDSSRSHTLACATAELKKFASRIEQFGSSLPPHKQIILEEITLCVPTRRTPLARIGLRINVTESRVCQINRDLTKRLSRFLQVSPARLSHIIEALDDGWHL